METNNSKDGVINESANSKESEEDESFVTKVRSRVSGLFSSSLSRLFKNQDKQTGVVRLRTDDNDEEVHQPPPKRARGMDNDVLSSKYFRESNNTQSELRTCSISETVSENNIEPIAGPSHISQRSSHNIISTPHIPTEVNSRNKYLDSGYSSMARVSNQQSQETSSVNVEKPNDTTSVGRKSLFDVSTPETPSRSLFTNQGTSPQDKNTSLKSRKPSFSTSTFGSPSFVDRTLTTNKIMNSPFYSGSTIYGGASAYGRQLGVNETRQQQLKNSFCIKPINKSSETKSFTSLSKTARRILETLEQCSTPLSDVKKVPIPTRSEKQGLFSKYASANPYQKNPRHSNKELLVPSVSDRLKMKQIQRLQDTTNEIRQIASSSSSSLNGEEYKVATDNQQKHTNKMKSKISSVRPKAATIEVIENYILNPVPLMIPENKLPKFEIPQLKVPITNPIISKDETVVEKNKLDDIKNVFEEKQEPKAEKESNEKQNKSIVEQSTMVKVDLKNSENEKDSKVVEYTFSKPLVIANNSKSIIAINNFKFSEPLSKKIKISEKITEPPQKKLNNQTKLTNGNISKDSDFTNSKSKTDPLLEKFKAPEGTWECQTCLIRNKSGVTKCAACETPKIEKSQNVKKDSFGLQFNKKTDEWDCSTCLVRNKVQNNICIACSTPKLIKPEINGIGNKLKTLNEWECKTCWVRNKNDSTKCIACETIRKDHDNVSKGATKCQKCFTEIKTPDGKCSLCESSKIKFDFPSHPKPSNDSWECGTCLIRNKNELKSCAACETPREKTVEEVKTLSTTNKTSDKWECPTCMVRNNSDVEKCPCCETAKPGVTLVSKSNVSMFNFGVNKTQFNFGIPKDMQPTNPSTSSFLIKPAETTTTAPVFKFGVPQETKDKVEEVPKISFPTLATPEVKSGTEEKEKLNESTQPIAPADKNSVPAFNFGAVSKPSEKTGSVEKPLFNFDSSKSNTVQNNFKLSGTLVPPSGGPAKTESTPFALPPTTNTDTVKPLFNFGSLNNSSKEPTEQKPMFSFGSSTSVSQGFNFNPPKGDVEQKLPLGGGFPTTQQQAQSTDSGNTTLKNGGFNFGSTSGSGNRAAVFSFGAAQNAPEPQQTAKVGFDFSAAVKPGGFNFTSPAPAFDSSAKPTFNFTGGSVPTFSANPAEGAGGPVPVRKFKRAVRRTQR